MGSLYDKSVLDDRRVSFLCCPPWVAVSLLFSLLITSPCVAETTTARQNGDWTSIGIGLAILVLATVASGWFFGRSLWRGRFSLGIAVFGAACGIGIGWVPRDAFAALVPALATVFGGTLVCALNAKLQSTTTRVGDTLSYATATYGIPLLFGLSLSGRLGVTPLFGDTRSLVAVTITLLAAVAVGLVVGRLAENAPLSLAAAAFGAFVGMATGLSPSAIVAYVAPAVLGLFTGAASYAFATSPGGRRSIGAILLSFGVLLVIGLFLGAISRLGLGWKEAPLLLFGFCAIMLPTLALGAAVGTLDREQTSGTGFAMLGSGVGLAIGLSHRVVTYVVTPGLVAVFLVLAVRLFVADREDQASRYRLLGVFAVLVLLGSFGGYALRQEGIRPQLEDLIKKVAALESKVPAEEFKPAADVLAKVVDQVDASISLWVEGSTVSSAVLIDVRVPLDGMLRVVDRVEGKVLFAGMPRQGDQLRLSGESLEISWPASAGVDSVGLTGWDRMVKQNGTWTVVGAGKAIDVSKAKIQNGRFILVFPSS